MDMHNLSSDRGRKAWTRMTVALLVVGVLLWTVAYLWLDHMIVEELTVTVDSGQISCGAWDNTLGKTK